MGHDLSIEGLSPVRKDRRFGNPEALEEVVEGGRDGT
jgi:hypothetical protein